MSQLLGDDFFMKAAIHQAKLALENDEVPIGAVIVVNSQIIAKAHNQTELLNDVTAHAEMLAITSAANFIGSKYLNDCSLYITLEPCAMCAGALAWSQIGRIVYGASDNKGGISKFGRSILHPKTKVEFGVLQEECQLLLKQFFKNKR